MSFPITMASYQVSAGLKMTPGLRGSIVGLKDSASATIPDSFSDIFQSPFSIPFGGFISPFTLFSRTQAGSTKEHDCPTLCGGRLYDLKEPTALMQFTGQPLITATRFEREALRCAKCQQRYVAPLPEGVKEERYDATCDATIALMRYGGGLPWHRQAGLQSMGGTPLGEATMWERCEATADAAMGIFLRLMRLAADGEVMHTDDTWVRILSCLKEDKEEKGRATNTSGIVVKAGGRKIALYLSGRRHAGENLAELLTKREKGLAPPIQMSDALAANTSVEKNVIRAYCLAH